jgi:hypothetical protein
MLDLLFNHPCPVDRVLSSPGLFFDVFVVLATVIFLIIFSRINKRFLYHYFTVMMGVFIFEMFTSPLWNNPHFGLYAYLYQDVSWVLTLGWTTMILSIILLVDTTFKNISEIRKFVLYLLGMSIFGFLAESTVVALGLRTYSDEVVKSLWGPYMWSVPIEVFYYIPVFSALIIGFYKFWAHLIEKVPIVPEKKLKGLSSLGISVVTVLLFELMVEPMVANVNLPSWSYIYKDISFIMTGVWILILWLSIKLVDKLFPHVSFRRRFGLYVVGGSILAIPLEYWYIANSFRVYGTSAVRDFIGIQLPFVNLPIEILFAMPLYFSLMIAFIKYWELVLNKTKYHERS